MHSHPHDRLLRACARQANDRPPVWMMRQAGRYLPEYRAVRATSDFLTMVRTPAIAAEITLQPVDLLGVDAAIIFSDILVVPDAMGMALRVDDGVGPVFERAVASQADVDTLRDIDPWTDLRYTLDAIRLVRQRNATVPIIGFAGAPWTLAAYMLEGRGSRDFQMAKRALLARPEFMHALLNRLAEQIGAFLVAQVEAGANVVQLFDSWAGALTPHDYATFALPALTRACDIARSAGAPVIVFPHGAPGMLEATGRATGADVIGVDWRTAPYDARAIADRLGCAVQGNLDPAVLLTDPERVREHTVRMLEALDGPGYIANLGHGITPTVPLENARAFIDTVRNWRSAIGARSTAAVGA